jgi:hypothetical protein
MFACNNVETRTVSSQSQSLMTEQTKVIHVLHKNEYNTQGESEHKYKYRGSFGKQIRRR